MKTLVIALGAVAAVFAAVAAVLYSGYYDISATGQHLAPTYRVFDIGLRQSVLRRAGRIEVPPLGDERQVALGLTHFRAHCVQCHGAPGVPPEPFALGLTPAPANLVVTAREWKPAQMYWVIREGIKMTGMPAWRYRLGDDEIWSIVAFLQRLPALSPAGYQALRAPPHPEHAENAEEQQGAAPAPSAEPDAERGRQAIGQHLCVTCHRIPGIVGPNAPVGPPLQGIGSRAFIAGTLPNSRENMVRWLREPQAVKPDGAMPDLGVSERDARDIAAYLATLR